MFDIAASTESSHEWDVAMPLDEKKWQIGLVTGPSGSGKSTIAQEFFKDAYFHRSFDWPSDKSVLDGFPSELDGRDITATLNAVGFSSPPSWLKPFPVLSTGQKFRAELARCLLLDAETVVFDEFTSVVDRQVAKICCAAVSKTIRKRLRPRLVALSCHHDIEEWLTPDWVYDVATGTFEWRRLRRRPAIQLQIFEAPVSAWAMFRGHHYLTGSIQRGAKCFVACLAGRPVAFTSHTVFPHPSRGKWRREHRTVVLPDFQGVGIGNALSGFMADKLTKDGFKFTSTTSHPAMIRHRLNDPKWKCIRRPSRVARMAASGNSANGASGNSAGRITASFEYVG